MKVALLGDIALFGKVSLKNNEKYAWMFSPIREILNQCDYVVANLESPLTNETKEIGGKSAHLKGNPEDIEILQYLGITHVTLANNHMFDYKAKGMSDTIETLDNHGIKWYGANGKVAFIENMNNKIVLLGGCCYSTNGKGLGKKSPCVNIFDPVVFEGMIEKYIQEGYLPIVSIHWGQEHVHFPNYDHIRAARKLCRNRKIIIHGHHPHVIQGIEKIDNSIVAYSLGNFCFDDIYTKKSKDPLVRLSKDNKESFIMILEINDNNVDNYQVIPFSFIDGYYKIDESIKGKINEWSDFLKISKKEYNKRRTSDLTAYINKRKKMRDAQWYLKRMNLDSISMIIAAKRNRKRYERVIKKYISE